MMIKERFHDNRAPKEGSQCIYLSILLIDSVFKVGKNYYTHQF